MLVQRRHLDIGAEADATAVRRLAAGEHVDESGLSRTVRSDDADAIATLHPDREPIHDLALPKGSADVFGFDDEFAGFICLRGGKVGVAGSAPIIAPLLAQRVEIAEPLDVALAAAGNPVAQPML